MSDRSAARPSSSRVDLRLAVLALGAPLWLGGCGTMVAQASPRAMRQPAAPPAMVAFYTNMITASEGPNGDCDRMIDEKGAALAAAADKALHDRPRPGMTVPPPSVLFGKLRAEHVTFSIALGPNGVPTIDDSISRARAQWRVPSQSPKEKSEYEAFRAKDARVGWVVDELELQIVGFAQAFLGAHYVANASRSGGQTLAGIVWTIRDSGMDDLEARGRKLVKKSLRCVHRGTALEAAATGVFAAYEAAASGEHPEIADKAIAALAGVLPVKDDATDAEVEAELDGVDARVKESYAKAGIAAPQGPMGFQAAQATGGAGGIDPASFLPAGTPARRVADGAEALLHGDYKAALRAVAPFAPGPLGAILGLAGSLLGG